MIQYRQVDFIAAHFKPEELVLAGPGRRLAGYLLDSIIQAIFIVIFLGSLIGLSMQSPSATSVAGALAVSIAIGWFAWWVYCASNGQTPGKQLLNMYVIKADGSRAGLGYILVRELVVKQLLGALLSLITVSVYGIVAGIWCIWDKDNQCLWDKIASTYVAWSLHGFKPDTAGERLFRGSPPRPVRPAEAAYEALHFRPGERDLGSASLMQDATSVRRTCGSGR